MFLGGCPCCGKKGPCWKCYGKSTLQVCDDENITAILTVQSVVDTEDGYTIDTSEETGLPLGATFNIIDLVSENGICRFTFRYESPNFGQPGQHTGITINASQRGYGNKTGSVTGIGLISLEPEQRYSPYINSNINTGHPWEDTVWQGYGKHVFVAPVMLDDAPTNTKIGVITFDINIIDLSADEPDIPPDMLEYKCFEKKPTEDGWLPVGKCHPTEAECNAACPPPRHAQQEQSHDDSKGARHNLERSLGLGGDQSQRRRLFL